MIRIFASIRRMLAVDKAARVVGAVGAEFVGSHIIPRLQELSKKEKDPVEAERLRVLAEEYVPYTKVGTHEYVDLQNTAEAAIRNELFISKLPLDMMDDLAQEVAQDFYMVRGAGTYMDRMKRFEPEAAKNGKAFSFTTWFYEVVKISAHTRARKMRDDIAKENLISPIEGEEGGVLNVVENLPDKSGVAPGEELDSYDDEEILEAMKPRLDKFVLSRARDKMAKDIYMEWWKAIEKKGADHVSFKTDVYPQLKAVYGEREKSFSQRVSEMKHDIEDFFNDVLGKRLTLRLKKHLRMSSVDVVAFDEYVRRFAAWMLGI